MRICPSTMAVAALRYKLTSAEVRIRELEVKLQYDWDQGASTAKDMTAVNRAVGVERGIDIPEKFAALAQRLATAEADNAALRVSLAWALQHVMPSGSGPLASTYDAELAKARANLVSSNRRRPHDAK